MVYRISDKYEIRANKLDYEVFEKRPVTNRTTKKETVKWVSTGKYPSTFSDALRVVYKLYMGSGEETIRGLKASIDHARKIEDEIMNYEIIEKKNEKHSKTKNGN